jgi:hypothetical protein
MRHTGCCGSRGKDSDYSIIKSSVNPVFSNSNAKDAHGWLSVLTTYRGLSPSSKSLTGNKMLFFFFFFSFLFFLNSTGV